MRDTLENLYLSSAPMPVRFRYALLTFDAATVIFFVVSTMVPETLPILVIEYAIAVVIAADFAARLTIAPRKTAFLLDPVSLADIIVIATLLAAPFLENLMFLRALRALRLVRSYHLLRDLRNRFPWFKRNQDIIGSSLNLVVFVFLVTALVYVVGAGPGSPIESYVDALYFTVTTLTTTGFGDITLEGPYGRLLAVFIMVAGVALFLRLVQTIFRPEKVRYTCPDCGLNRHDADAIHCKHCGHILHIETEGD